MKLLSVHIENFGKLHDFDRDFSGGINSVTEENGWGKTTLSTFLLVMFYGFDDKLTKKLREKYAPWNGGIYGGSVIFEAGGKNYIAERTFGHKKSMEDTFVLRDAETNLVSADFDEYLGDELFKINTESFMKTVFIGRSGCVTETTDDINAKIGDLSMVESDMRSYSDAQERLNDYLNKNSDSRKTGRIYALKEKAAELKNKARFATGIGNELADCDNNLAKLSREAVELEAVKNEAIELQTRIVRCKEAVLANEKYKVLLSGAEAAKKSAEEPLPKSGVSGMALIIMGLLLTIGGIILIVVDELFPDIIAVIAGVLITAMGLMVAFRREKRRAEREKKRNEICETAEREFREYEKTIDINEVRRLASMPEATLSLKDTDKKRSETSDRLDRVTKELQRLDTRREFLTEELASAEMAETKASELDLKIDEGIELLERARKTSEFLEEAKTGFALRYLEPLKNSLCEYYDFLKGKGGAKCRLDANLVLTLEEGGKQRKEEDFSDGIRDALGLCMRFALIDAMYPGEAPFVIMDDPFIRFDSETREAAMKLLKHVPYQIVLMQKK